VDTNKPTGSGLLAKHHGRRGQKDGNRAQRGRQVTTCSLLRAQANRKQFGSSRPLASDPYVKPKVDIIARRLHFGPLSEQAIGAIRPKSSPSNQPDSYEGHPLHGLRSMSASWLVECPKTSQDKAP
jgi:hypothetical protein